MANYVFKENVCGFGIQFDAGTELSDEHKKLFSEEKLQELQDRKLLAKIEEVKELSEEEKLALSKNTKDKK